MTVTYAAVFDVATLRTGLTATEYAFSMTMTSATLGNIVITDADFLALGDTRVAHDDNITDTVNHDGVAMFQTYLDHTFASALQAIIAAKMASVSPSWTGSITVSFANDRYTIARSSGSFSFAITWGNAATGYLLGFSGNATSGTSHVGDLTPTYWIRATQAGRSDDAEGDFEPGEIADISIADDASDFSGVARTTSPKYRAWVQQFEVKRKVFKAFQDGTDRWTFEHLFEHCRTVRPFIVDDGEEKMACVFLSEGSAFRGKQRPGGPGDDVQMHVPFLVWHAGEVVPPS